MVTFRSIILCALFCASALAAPAISIEKETPDGVFQNAFTQENGEWIYVKNTNFFDGSELSLGKYKIPNQKDLKKAVAELEKIELALKQTEAKFPDSNETDKKLLHERHYKVGKYVITPEHALYERTSKVFEALRFNAKTEIQEGVKIDTTKLAQKISFKKGKQVSSEPYNISFECQKRDTTTACELGEYGLLFLDQKQ